MNNITIIGNLTRDPEVRNVNNANVTNFSVAVNEGKDNVTYFNVAAWNVLGDTCAKYLAKGRKVAVTGRVGVRAYVDKAGKPAASLQVSASNVEFLSGNGNAEGGNTAAPAPKSGRGSRATAIPTYETEELPWET